MASFNLITSLKSPSPNIVTFQIAAGQGFSIKMCGRDAIQPITVMTVCFSLSRP